MISNTFYGPETQGDYKLYDLGNLILESGETLRNAKLAYRTFALPWNRLPANPGLCRWRVITRDRQLGCLVKLPQL